MPEIQQMPNLSPEPGDSIGKYELREQLADEEHALLYRGYDPFMDRDIAIRVAKHRLSDTAAKSAATEQAFFREAQAAGVLNHPNIAEIYDAGSDDGRCYIVMEYIPGCTTLARFTRPDNLLNVKAVTELVYQCALALDYAHREGVVHRDVKPANLLLTQGGTVKVSNFAAAMIGEVEKPELHGRAGSPLYMSPEQVVGEPVNSQTDLFSLGLSPISC